MTSPNTSMLTLLRAAVGQLIVAVALASVIVVLSPLSAHAGERLTVVELFSAQGCPLCPPAEAYLGTLTEREGLLPLAFHVDYWDHLGWRDRFAEAAYSRRQQRYSGGLGLPYVYTPQIIVDGHLEASGGKPDEVEAEIAAARGVGGDSVEVTLTRLSPTRLRVEIPQTTLADGGADILLIGFDQRHETEIERGENSGMTLINYHVVRDARAIASWDGTRFDLTVPLGGDHGVTDYCAVIVQQAGQGRIIGAAMVDMRMSGATPGYNG